MSISEDIYNRYNNTCSCCFHIAHAHSCGSVKGADGKFRDAYFWGCHITGCSCPQFEGFSLMEICEKIEEQWDCLRENKKKPTNK